MNQNENKEVEQVEGAVAATTDTATSTETQTGGSEEAGDFEGDDDQPDDGRDEAVELDEDAEGDETPVIDDGSDENENSIVKRVSQIVAEQLGVSQADIKTESNFVDDLGADSLDTVELVMALEDEFELEIPDSEAEKITTVQQAVEWLGNHGVTA